MVSEKIMEELNQSMAILFMLYCYFFAIRFIPQGRGAQYAKTEKQYIFMFYY